MNKQTSHNKATPYAVMMIAVAFIAISTMTAVGSNDNDQPTADSTGSGQDFGDSDQASATIETFDVQINETITLPEATYRVPGHSNSFVTEIAIADNIVESISFEHTPGGGSSEPYIERFDEGIDEVIQGQDVANLLVEFVSGASLSSRAFYDALRDELSAIESTQSTTDSAAPAEVDIDVADSAEEEAEEAIDEEQGEEAPESAEPAPTTVTGFTDTLALPAVTYRVPGHSNTFSSQVTVVDNIIESVSFDHDYRPSSEFYINRFNEGIDEVIVGQDITSLEDIFVSGASLSSRAFYDTLRDSISIIDAQATEG